jgi:hypothetical protein
MPGENPDDNGEAILWTEGVGAGCWPSDGKLRDNPFKRPTVISREPSAKEVFGAAS